tara:strand:+ start:14997 stop:15113 length:117 start_codon:yes stop_codon:yes gene_type:complete
MKVRIKRLAIAKIPCTIEVDDVSVEDMILPIAIVNAKS